MIGDASESLKAKRLKFRLQLYLRRKEKFTNLAFFIIFIKTLFINAGFKTDNAKNMQNTEQLFRIASNFQTLSSGNVTSILVLTCLGWK